MNEARLNAINPDRVRWATDSTVVVREMDPTGRADVTVHLAPGYRALQLHLDENAEALLRDRQNADGHIAIEGSAGTWELLVIECKVKLTPVTLPKAEKQLVASLTRMQLVADFLGLNVQARRAWIACQRDLVSPTTNPNPITLKTTVGARAPETAAALARWRQGKLPDGHCHAGVTLEKIALTPDEGKGDLHL